MDTTPIPDWSSLPKDLLCFIGNLLLLHHSLVDLLRFRAVCHSFRSSAPFPKKPTIHNSAFRILFSKPSIPGHNENFLLMESTVYAIQPLETISSTPKRTPTWLLKKLEHSNSAGKLRIKDPILGNDHRFSKFSHKLPKSLNLLDYRVIAITQAYRLEFADNPTLHYFRKVVVSTDGFEIMAITWDLEAFLWRNGDEEWSKIGFHRQYIKDIAYHNNMFYALNNEGVTKVVDSKSLRITKLLRKPWGYSADCDWYLVKSLKDLYLIVKYTKWLKIKNCVKVYKVDEEKSEWVEEMNGLKEKAFVVGGDCSFSFSTKEFPGCKGNCIYFLSNIQGPYFGQVGNLQICEL